MAVGALRVDVDQPHIVLDVAGVGYELEVPVTTLAAYIFEGEAKFDYSSTPVGVKVEKSFNNQDYTIRDMSGNKTLITFDKGDEIKLLSGDRGVRFLLVSGNPIKEPVAWHGPIVMNTHEEIKLAMTELNNGTFIKE